MEWAILVQFVGYFGMWHHCLQHLLCFYSFGDSGSTVIVLFAGADFSVNVAISNLRLRAHLEFDQQLSCSLVL